MPTPITKRGYDALKAELDRLRKVERPQVIEAIAKARARWISAAKTRSVMRPKAGKA
jgi:transcription elongation GreA/GreB family factor